MDRHVVLRSTPLIHRSASISLRNLLENVLLQRQLRQLSLELCILFFDFLYSFLLIQLQAAVFLLPALPSAEAEVFCLGEWIRSSNSP
jgi:hypothetical protein